MSTDVPRDCASLAERFLTVWDDAPEAIVALDTGWRYAYLNAAAEVLLGVTRDVLTRDSRTVQPNALGTPFADAYERVMRTGAPETVDHRFAPLDTYLRATIRAWPDGIVIFLRDTTAERRPQVRLRRDAEFYQQILDQMSPSLTLRDLDGRFVLVNRAAADLLGRSPHDLVGRLTEEVFAADVAAVSRTADRAVVRSGEVQEDPVGSLLHPERTLITKVFPVRDEDGMTVAVATSTVDVSDVVATQAELAASHLRFRRVFGSTSLAVIVAHVDGPIVEANTAACRMLGYSRGQLLQMTAVDLLPPDRRSAAGLRRRLGRDGAEGYELEDQLQRSDGEVFPVLVTVNTWDDPIGTGTMLSVVVRDLTALHALQQRLLATTRMEAVGQLAAGIAHDANNILAGVAGYAELLAPHVADRPAAMRHLAGISRSVGRAGELVDRLTAVGLGQTTAPSALDLAEVVRDLTELLHRLLPDTIDLVVDVAPAPATGDASEIRQVLLNLVVNARNALTDGGTIHVSTGVLHDPAAPPMSVITVGDDGPGMTEAVAARCFEPFFTTRDASGGTGVGLSTALHLAQQNGGELRLTTELGTGTTFVLALPWTTVEPTATLQRAT